MSKTLSVIVAEEDGGYVALNPDTNVASQGDAFEQALDNLKEALGLYFEELSDTDSSDLTHTTFLTTVTI